MTPYQVKLSSGRIDALFRAAPTITGLGILGGMIGAFLMRNTLSAAAETGFLILLFGVFAVRIVMIRRYRSDPDRLSKTPIYGRAYAFAAFVTGSIWGVFGFMSMTAADNAFDLLTTGLLVSCIAFGGVAHAIYPPVFYALGLPINILLAVGLIARNDEWGYLLGAIATLLIPVHILIGRTVAGLTLDALRLRIENETLIQDLIAARERAEAGNRAKSEFLAVMSHEIRTPMTAILGLSEVAIDRAADPEQLKQLELVRESGVALLNILNDILDLSKLEAERLEFEVLAFDLARLLQSVVTLMSSRAAGKNLTMSLKTGDDLPAFVSGDAGRLRQVLVNLIANAIKFTDAGRIDVGAEIVTRDAQNVTVKFSIADTGIGIAPEIHARVFDSFAQADSSISRRFGGTGLGLAICRNIIERQGGRIGVVSEPGKGANFWFELRFTVADMPDIHHVAEGETIGRPLKVLLAEDNAVIQFLVREILERDGHEIEIVDSGLKAIDAAASRSFDIVLMDLQMPEMGGLDAARGIRALEAPQTRIPILALTAATSADETAASLAAGMDGVLAKPFRAQELIGVIAKCCAAGRLHAGVDGYARRAGDVVIERR